MRDGFYGWLAVPHTHSRQSERWNFFRTAPLKACDEPSRPTVRWPLGRTDEFELRCKRGKSTRSAPTDSERAACAVRMARAGAATRESFRGARVLSWPLVRQTDVADSPRGGLSLWSALPPAVSVTENVHHKTAAHIHIWLYSGVLRS